jgi:cell division protein FtsQ
MRVRNIRSIKRNRERKKNFYLFFVIFLIFGSVLSLFFLLKHYPKVREIVVSGNRHVKKEEVKAFLGTVPGDPLFSVSGKVLFERLRKSPWIRDAVIRRDPSGSLLVLVIEETPAAILNYASTPYLVADDGTVLEQLKGGTFFLPIIKDIDPYKNVNTFKSAVALVKLLRDREITAYEGVVQIYGQRPEDLTLRVDNVSIRIGAGDYEKKLERMLFVREEIQKRGINVESIDLRFMNKVVVRQINHAITDMER